MFSFHLKLWGIFAISIISLVISVRGDCFIKTFENSPLFVKSVGSRQISFERTGEIQLMEGENITINCPVNIGFEVQGYPYDLKYYNSVRSIELSCAYNSYVYKRPDDELEMINSKVINVNCIDDQSNTLYESLNTLPSCQPYITYAVGLTDSVEVIRAGFCYDLDTMSLKFANFVAYRRKYEHLVNKTLIANIHTASLDMKIINWQSYFKFMSEPAFQKSLELQKVSNSLLSFHEFDFASLIQDEPLVEDMQNFDQMLNTVWWRNLRVGNWQYFLAALKERTKTVTYNVYTGTSGQITMPIPTSSCSKIEYLSFKNDTVSVTVPEYVWYYINSITRDVTEEFVVIGYNSPFYKSNDVVLCKDICDEIDWLKTSIFGQVRSMPTMGLMFCCRPKEVAKKIQPFPIEL